jgi:uncharacterized protein
MDILLILLGFVITLGAQLYVNSSYNKYKVIKNKNGLSGFEVARKILDENNLKNIHVVETNGMLSDHYDPKRKVIRLSAEIFNGTSIASVAVAAHEVGHAIQHKNNYTFIKIRSYIFPIVNIGSKLGYFAIIIGFIAGITDLLWLGIASLLLMLIFQLITLPVEFDASKRAKEQLKKEKIIDNSEVMFAQNMLNAAAFTYVAALVTTLLEVIRLVLIARDRD